MAAMQCAPRAALDESRDAQALPMRGSALTRRMHGYSIRSMVGRCGPITAWKNDVERQP